MGPTREAGRVPPENEALRHEQIWAPWRLAYIKQEEEPERVAPGELDLLPGADAECFLCQAAADPDDRRRYVICREARSMTLLNRYPYNNGHLLVAPRRHRARLDQLTAAEQTELSEGIARMVGLLEKALAPHGFNVGLNLGEAAGAGLPGHLHWHVVPRWNGDTNFMPTLAAVRVIPQSLEALWEALTAELAAR
jgi:ATP adenylyltransferase